MKLIHFIRGIGRHSPNMREVCLFPPLHFSRVYIYITLATRNKFNNIITKEYNNLMKDIPKEDMSVRREKLKHVYEWRESSSVIPSNKLAKSIAAKLENMKVQFLGLVSNSQMVYSTIYFSQAEAWCNLEEIQIIGVLMYVGKDPAGHQLSGIFGRSDIVRKFINNHGIDVCDLMDKYTSIFKYVFASICCNP